MRALAAALALLAAACSSSSPPDVCAGVAGGCVALEVRAPSTMALAFDQLHVIASGFSLDARSPTTPDPTLHLPVIAAIEPPAGFSGAFTLTVELDQQGGVVGRWTASDTLDSPTAHVFLATEAQLGAAGDLGPGGAVDMSACPAGGCFDPGLSGCVGKGQLCKNMNVCSTGSECAACGYPGKPCCPPTTGAQSCLEQSCCDGVSNLCVAFGAACSQGGTCSTMGCASSCGGNGQACCPTGSMCTAGLSCFSCSGMAVCLPTSKGCGFADGGINDAGTPLDGGADMRTACVPLTCPQLNANCGVQGDGCGGMLSCGSCSGTLLCGAGSAGPSQCGTSCVPRTSCPAGLNCGIVGDGCGGTISCGGACPSGQSCGGGGTANVCGVGSCTPLTCMGQNLGCGMQSDGCGNQINCGTCTAPQSCGAGGMPSQCGFSCVPRSCQQQNIQCGPADDGCGNTIQCGSCTPPQTCGGGGTHYQCG